jgi:membrane-associated phospholipid phosphatase
VSLVRRFDEWFDGALDHVRGHRLADRVFYMASAVGDMSLIWHVVSATRSALDPSRRRDAVRLSATLGVESLLVNQGVKRLFNRGRPVFEGDRAHYLRTPLTTSFPSGHASAAFCAAVVLSAQDSPWTPLWYGMAAVVALSRPYVRIHHGSDVIAGAAVGYGLGRLALAAWPR